MALLAQKLPLDQMQTKWAASLNPVLSNPLIDGQLLEGIQLPNGTVSINHGLARRLQGWFIVGINTAATVYDNQATNQMPQLTLSLTSNAVCTVNLWVF